MVDRAPTEQASAVRLEVHGVSPRERDVAVLLARGAGNAEIAAALVLSPYTAQDHVRSLFDKTGVASARNSSPASSSTTTCRRSRNAPA